LEPGQIGLTMSLPTGELSAQSSEESAALFKKLVDQAGESIFVIDPATGVFLDVNAAACRALGYSREELLRMGVQDVEAAGMEDSGWDIHVGVVKPGGEKMITGAYRRKDGSVFPVEVNVKGIREGSREYVVAFARDASERKAAMARLKESEEQLSTIMEAVPVSIMILDQSGSVLYFNLTSADWYGVSTAAVLGQPEPDIWANREEKERFYDLLEKRGYLGDFETLHKAAGGAEQWALVSGVKILLKGAPVKLITRRDITPQKQAEESLKAAKTLAENATALKDQFVSLVSHDLRSPLSAIQGLLGLLKGYIKSGKVGEKTMEIIDKTAGAADMMVTMVDQLLDISRLQTGKIVPEKERFSAHNFVNDCVETVDYLAAEKGITVQNEIPRGMVIEADRALLAEVIGNLLSNAVKFCKAGDAITTFNPGGRPGVVAVRDTGAGMDDFTRENVFKHEVKTTTVGTAGERGTGLGLPYCHDIMAAHGGTLTVESGKGRGTVFYVTLPEAKERDN
jgi:PAS domain S-box-containing protein